MNIPLILLILSIIMLIVVLWYVITNFKSICNELDGETMDNKILTAEDFLQEHLEISHFYDDKTNRMVCFSEDVQQVMIEFAQLHVQNALESASENVELETYGSFGNSINKDSILNSYPLDLIK